MDLIRREDAIKAIENLPNAYNGWSDAYDKAYIIGTLEELPSAEKQGEWLYARQQLEIVPMWECSYCMVRMPKKFNFCPNCGCRMKGADDE